ncbi:MAG: hypothetical protein N2205_07960 [Candidatus Caldatribacterium sp.]|uniref:baeRF10 domain-containing protein n=1 Tax=Candidatus Caldatribacterium sp. TaxID=2282143 RepID=UPI0029920470|nr:hypothetical protein [Candidatus Caldatribacterium sp.]MCX7731128.1 hypothetical protein [Candidatus Caldatribacterium sp.]MDW8080840.1 hypothetical protein [Candidatus Calescibacterium sp.]
MGRFVEGEELERLSSRHFAGDYVLSVYCPLRSREEYKEAIRRLEAFSVTLGNFEREAHEIIRYLIHYAPGEKVKGLAFFTSMLHDFFEVYELPQAWKFTVVYGSSPYTRPLEAIFGEYPRIMLVLADRREARFFEIYMGEVREHEPLSSDVPSRVRSGGWYGLEERRIARSIEQKVLQHLQDVVDALVEHFRKRHFEVFFVGLRDEEYVLFTRILPSYLQGKFKGRVELDPKSDRIEILSSARRLEEMVREEEDNALLDRLLTMVGNADLAVVGLPRVLRAALFGACQMVVVEEGYKEAGFLCRSCGTMTLLQGGCELCGGEQEEVDDVVGEILEIVVLQRGEVKYVLPKNPKIFAAQHIGAFLRFQV